MARRQSVEQLAIDPDWESKLRHMLGAGAERPKRDHGFRNHYCTSIGSESHGVLLEMQQAGLVRSGRSINEGRDQYFHATVDGCKAIGLAKAAIKRAFSD